MKKTRFSWSGMLHAVILGLIAALFIGVPAVWTVSASVAVGMVLPYIAPQNSGYAYNLGYAPYLLRHIKEVAMGNTPSEKISSPGYLLMLAKNSTPVNVVNEGQFRADGTVQEMRVKYRNRVLESAIQTSDSCDIDGIPVYKETTISVDNVAKYAFYIDDTVIAQYMKEASQTVMVGKPASMMMQEHLGALLETLNAFYGKMDTVLSTAQASAFGVHIGTGNNNAVTVNFNDDTTVNLFTEGLTKILADYQDNELAGMPYIVGSGLFHKYHLQQAVKGLAQNGIDTSRFQNGYEFFYDRKVATTWGANQIGVFAPNSVKALYRNEYMGAFAGKKGESLFFTMTPPVVDVLGNPLSHDLFKLDVQMKYVDCPQDLADAGYSGTYNAKRGWYLIIKKAYDQFNIPGDAHDADDDFYGVNGTLRYTITNT